jgi:signal transduction histidine kinase
LFRESQAEQKFLVLINATVSHELRNPLFSLISQIMSLKEFLADFKQAIEALKLIGPSQELK